VVRACGGAAVQGARVRGCGATCGGGGAGVRGCGVRRGWGVGVRDVRDVRVRRPARYISRGGDIL
jgi:hypothetical protein